MAFSCMRTRDERHFDECFYLLAFLLLCFRWLRNLNCGEPIHSGARTQVATLEVLCGGQYASHVILPELKGPVVRELQ